MLGQPAFMERHDLHVSATLTLLNPASSSREPRPRGATASAMGPVQAGSLGAVTKRSARLSAGAFGRVVVAGEQAVVVPVLAILTALRVLLLGLLAPDGGRRWRDGRRVWLERGERHGVGQVSGGLGAHEPVREQPHPARAEAGYEDPETGLRRWLGFPARHVPPESTWQTGLKCESSIFRRRPFRVETRGRAIVHGRGPKTRLRNGGVVSSVHQSDTMVLNWVRMAAGTQDGGA